MFRIYLDKQIFSYLFNEKRYKEGTSSRTDDKYAALLDKIYNHKDEFMFYFSEAHMMDLSKDKTDRKYEEFDFMESICNHNGLAFIDNRPTSYNITPREGFDEYSNIKPLDLENINVDEIGDTQIKSIANSVEILKKNFNGELAKDWLTTREPIADIQQAKDIISDADDVFNIAKFVAQYPQIYKNLRDTIIDETNSKKGLDIDSGNVESADLPFSGFLSETLRQMGLENCSELQYYIIIYYTLDMLGISPDKRRILKFDNLVADARHSYFASLCDCMVVNDKGLVLKTRKIYDKFGIKTKVLGVDEFISAFEQSIEINSRSAGELVFSLIDYVNGSNIIGENKEDDYHMILFEESSTSYLGYFSVVILHRKDGETNIILKRDNGSGSTFLTIGEIRIMTNKLTQIMPIENKEEYYFNEESDLNQLRQNNWRGKHWLFTDVDFSFTIGEEYSPSLFIRIKDEELLSKLKR